MERVERAGKVGRVARRVRNGESGERGGRSLENHNWRQGGEKGGWEEPGEGGFRVQRIGFVCAAFRSRSRTYRQNTVFDPLGALTPTHISVQQKLIDSIFSCVESCARLERWGRCWRMTRHTVSDILIGDTEQVVLGYN